jgi:type II secretory pathway component PulK
MRRGRIRRERRGTALLAALATIAVLATVTAMVSRGARSSAAVVHNARADAVARAMAESGVLAAVDRLDGALAAARDSAQRLAVFDALMESPRRDGAPAAPFVADTLDNGVFAVAVVNVSARFDVNSGDVEGLTRLFATVAPASDAAAAAARIQQRLQRRPASRGARDAMRDSLRAVRDSVAAALLGRPTSPEAAGRFDSLDELAAWLGADAPWLPKIAAYLTVDGDGVIDRRHAPAPVLRAASGSLVDAPTRLLIVSRGWERDQPLTREIQAVYAVEQDHLALVRWREQRR